MISAPSNWAPTTLLASALRCQTNVAEQLGSQIHLANPLPLHPASERRRKNTRRHATSGCKCWFHELLALKLKFRHVNVSLRGSLSLSLSLSLPPSIHLSSSVIYIYIIYCVIYTSPLLGDSLPALVSATVFYMGALDTSAMIFNGLLMLIKFLFLCSVSNSTGAGSFTFSTQRHA